MQVVCVCVFDVCIVLLCTVSCVLKLCAVPHQCTVHVELVRCAVLSVHVL
jgi:hypothetical protein